MRKKNMSPSQLHGSTEALAQQMQWHAIGIVTSDRQTTDLWRYLDPIPHDVALHWEVVQLTLWVAEHKVLPRDQLLLTAFSSAWSNQIQLNVRLM